MVASISLEIFVCFLGSFSSSTLPNTVLTVTTVYQSTCSRQTIPRQPPSSVEILLVYVASISVKGCRHLWTTMTSYGIAFQGFLSIVDQRGFWKGYGTDDIDNTRRIRKHAMSPQSQQKMEENESILSHTSGFETAPMTFRYFGCFQKCWAIVLRRCSFFVLVCVQIERNQLSCNIMHGNTHR